MFCMQPLLSIYGQADDSLLAFGGYVDGAVPEVSLPAIHCYTTHQPLPRIDHSLFMCLSLSLVTATASGWYTHL